MHITGVRVVSCRVGEQNAELCSRGPAELSSSVKKTILEFRNDRASETPQRWKNKQEFYNEPNGRTPQLSSIVRALLLSPRP